MRRPIEAILSLVTVAVAAQTNTTTTVPLEGRRLTYGIERLNNAKSAHVASPGAGGSASCFVLTRKAGGWSRFNWPRFEPLQTAREVSFWSRRLQGGPERMLVRVLRGDGTEWQSEWVGLSDEWEKHSLTASDFRLFRGGDAATAGALSLGEAVQFQVVPSSSGEGLGPFALDEIIVAPGGPSFTADGEELEPVPDPAEMERERLQDLIGRWRLEEAKLGVEEAHALQWERRLSEIAARWSATQPERRPAMLRQAETEGLPWCAQPGEEELRRVPRPDHGLSDTAYEETVRAHGSRPESGLLDFRRPVEVRASRLYAAPGQDDPEVVTVGGEPVLRHRLVFTAEASRQTVFTVMQLPEPVDLTGRALVVRMRCTASLLNETYPLLLRVWTGAAGQAESWGDLAPETTPGGEWSDVRFDVDQPARGVRYTPSAARALHVRIENRLGNAADFVLEIAAVRLGWPDPVALARRGLIAQQMANVRRARASLYRVRDRIARLEAGLSSTPALRDWYLSSFLWRGGAADGQAATRPVLDPGIIPERPLAPDRIVSRLELTDGGVVLRLTGCPPENSAAELRAELYGPAGDLVTSGRTEGTLPLLELPVRQPRLWEPGHAPGYELRAALRQGHVLVSAVSRRVGLHASRRLASGPCVSLRHARGARQPDFSLHWNGTPFFPHVARYHWPEQDKTVLEGVRMLGDLWVVGQRDYGLALRPGKWDLFEQAGLVRFASVAPRYSGLTGWGDVAHFAREFGSACSGLRRHADRAFMAAVQVGNEVELSIWGADLSQSFPDGLYHPLDVAAGIVADRVGPTAPIMYVRAGSFRKVPPLPHEEVCGVNQYTGRYGGRIDEVVRNLAELARFSVFCARPLIITEWNGPKYSWASSGVGGVSPRGCAYYVEQYFRAMVDTPGIVGSSEFTLNWIIAPFEDFTNQTREEAMKDRPKHHAFGGGRTADHVPIVAPPNAVRGPCFRAMQAFQGPLYPMVTTPGAIRILHTATASPDAERIRAVLAQTGKEVACERLGTGAQPRREHALLLLHPADASLRLSAWSQIRDAGAPVPLLADQAESNEPFIRRRINARHPDYLTVVLTAADEGAFRRGSERLLASAEAWVELAGLEGAMTRAVALTDPGLVRYYERYILEFAARGFLFGGDDTRTRLAPREFYGEAGRRPAWQGLSAVILDCDRELDEEEQALVERFVTEGVNLVISLPCYRASAFIKKQFPAQIGEAVPLADPLPTTDVLPRELPVRDMGGADMAAIRAFRPDLADSPALRAAGLTAPDALPLVTTADGSTAVALRWQRGRAAVSLLSVPVGEVARIHWSVTHAGKTHSLYDRGTACGLERVSRVVVNCARIGAPAPQVKPRLFVRLEPDATLVEADEPIRVTAKLTDAEGRPVAGQLRVRARLVADGSAGRSTPYAELQQRSPGEFAFEAEPAPEPFADPGFTPRSTVPFAQPRSATALHQVTFQFRAYAPGCIPANAGLSLVLGLGE